MYEIHEVFFETPVRDQMVIIAQSRQHEQELYFKEQVGGVRATWGEGELVV